MERAARQCDRLQRTHTPEGITTDVGDPLRDDRGLDFCPIFLPRHPVNAVIPHRAGAGDGQRTVVVCPERIVAAGVRVGEHSGIKRGGRIYRAVRGGPRRLRPAACSDGVMERGRCVVLPCLECVFSKIGGNIAQEEHIPELLIVRERGCTELSQRGRENIPRNEIAVIEGVAADTGQSLRQSDLHKV